MGAHRIYTDELDNELKFSFVRSGGPGGQHVNKVNTKAELRFDIGSSKVLDETEKMLIRQKLTAYISKEDVLIVVSDASRSQLKNKEDTRARFYRLINKALKPVKKRKPTTVPDAAKEKRLKLKKALSEKKERRRRGVEE